MTTLLARFALQHLAVVATWSVMAVVFVGLGLAFRRLFVRDRADASDVGLALWVGFALTLLVAILWHFLLPIDARLTSVVTALGVAGLVVTRASWIPVVRARERWGQSRLGIALAAGYAAWAANRALGVLSHYDSGMYHVPTVDWSNAFAVVPGLGNLHGRLAFNASSLLYAALLDVGPWDGASFHLANGFLLVALAVPVMFTVARLLGGRAPTRPTATAFAAILFVPLVAALLGEETRSLDTDVPVAVVLLYCGYRIFRAYDERTEGHEARWQLAALTLLLTAAITLKLSAVVIAAALFAATVWAYRQALAPLSALVAAWTAPAVLLVAWAARGVVLSGYPLYPSTAFGFPVAWRLDPQQAVAEAAWIRVSAKALNHNRITVGFDWFLPWAKEVLSDVSLALYVPMPLLVAVVAALLLAWRWRSGRARTSGWPVLAAAAAGAVFWFVVAPHPRFGQASLWLAGASVVAMLAGTVAGNRVAPLFTRVSRVVVALAAVGIVIQAVRPPDAPGGGRRRRASSLGRVLTAPPPDGKLLTMPSATLLTYRTLSGLELRVPKDNNLCWHGPLLCTPHPEPNLSLRVPGQLGSGFVSTGGVWRPVRWPNPWTPFLPFLACVRERGSAAEGACERETRDVVTDTLSRVAQPAPAEPSGGR